MEMLYLLRNNMKLYFKFLAVTLVVFNLVEAQEHDGNESRPSSPKTQPVSAPFADEAEMKDFTDTCCSAVKKAHDLGPKPFIRRLKRMMDNALDDRNIDYLCGLYSNLCNTVPEPILLFSGLLFVDSSSFGFFCDSHLGALAVSSVLCYGASWVSQLFSSNSMNEENRRTILGYCVNKMLSK